MELAAQKREALGKAVGALREKGFIPAELYGKGMENVHLSVPIPDFMKLFKEAGRTTVVNLTVGTTAYPVVIHDIQRDLVSGAVRHVDFYKVRMDEKIRAKVPLEFVGESPAAKTLGAVLTKSMTEVEVEALPNDLPRRLAVNLEGLAAIGQSVYVRDIAVPARVAVLADPASAVVSAAAPKEEKAEAAPTDVSAVKVETEEKKEERAAEKEGEAGTSK